MVIDFGQLVKAQYSISRGDSGTYDGEKGYKIKLDGQVQTRKTLTQWTQYNDGN